LGTGRSAFSLIDWIAFFAFRVPNSSPSSVFRFEVLYDLVSSGT